MSNKFAVGDRVGMWNEDTQLDSNQNPKWTEYDGGPVFGVVKEILSDKQIRIEWDDEYLNDYPEETDRYSSEVMTEDEANKAWSDLEAKFVACQAAVAEKLKVAADAIAEAQKIAESYSYDLIELDSDVLEGALDDAGWRTSSWHC